MTALLKVIKWFALLAVTVLILVWLFVWLVASGSAETTVYKENDFFNYHALTDKNIENVPRITDDFYFESHPGDGYAPSNSIVLKALSDQNRFALTLKNWVTRGKSVAWGIRKYGRIPSI